MEIGKWLYCPRLGESRHLVANCTHTVSHGIGTPLYMAPEMHEEEGAKGPKVRRARSHGRFTK